MERCKALSLDAPLHLQQIADEDVATVLGDVRFWEQRGHSELRQRHQLMTRCGQQELQRLGWSIGGNLRIDIRWGIAGSLFQLRFRSKAHESVGSTE